MKSYENPKGQVVGNMRDGIYRTDTKHFMGIFQGHGISDSIISDLVKDGCHTVIITYHGKPNILKLKTKFSDWVESTKKRVDTSMGEPDPQTFISQRDMEKIE